MRISLFEKSKYYRALLLLTGKDGIIDNRERALMLEIGRILDFERRFCEAAIDDLLGNKHLHDEPSVFSDRKIAECFLIDAACVASADGEINTVEMAWIKAVALANGIPEEWLTEEIQRLQDGKDFLGLPASPAILRCL